MGLIDYDFNPFTGNLDEISEEMVVVSSAPTSGVSGVLYQVSSDPTKIYYFSGGNRYRIDATLDNPITSGGIIPLWFTLIPQ
jgi:hypothetical protein